MAQCHKRAFVNHPARASHSPTHPQAPATELVRSWSENRPAQMSPLEQADKIQPPDISDLPPTRSTLSAPLAGLTAGCK